MSDLNEEEITEEIELSLREGNYREALELLNRALSLGYGKAGFTIQKGILLGKSGRTIETLSIFDDLLIFRFS